MHERCEKMVGSRGEKFWSSEGVVEHFIELVNSGRSSRVIARTMNLKFAHLNNPLTRNSVIGKADGLKSKGYKIKLGKTTVETMKGFAKMSPKKSAPMIVQSIFPVESEVSMQEINQDVALLTSRKVKIMQLAEGVCRWPLGAERDKAIWYCGAGCNKSKVYCEAHSKIAHQPNSGSKNKTVKK